MGRDLHYHKLDQFADKYHVGWRDNLLANLPVLVRGDLEVGELMEHSREFAEDLLPKIDPQLEDQKRRTAIPTVRETRHRVL